MAAMENEQHKRPYSPFVPPKRCGGGLLIGDTVLNVICLTKLQKANNKIAQKARPRGL